MPTAQKGWVYLIGAGPGAADLITLRGWSLLQSADVAVVDALVDPALYDHLPAQVVDAGKRAGAHGMKQDEINAALVSLARAGHSVVRLKGGDSFVFGRAGEEIGALLDAGIPFAAVPGVTSAVAAPSLAGIPLTLRGIADAFWVVSAHLQDGVAVQWPSYQPRATLVVLMGVASRATWVPRLLALGYPPELPMAWITWAGRPEQATMVCTLGSCLQDCERVQLHSPSVAVLGAVVGQRWQP